MKENVWFLKEFIRDRFFFTESFLYKIFPTKMRTLAMEVIILFMQALNMNGT